MPLREYICPDLDCRLYNYRRERYEHTTPPPSPSCVECGAEMQPVLSTFSVVFTGVLSGTKYKEPGIVGYGKDGHWAVDKSGADGVPKHVFIETFDQQRDFCKRNKLVNPKDIGSLEAGSDGKTISTSGLPSAAIMAKEYTAGNPDR